MSHISVFPMYSEWEHKTGLFYPDLEVGYLYEIMVEFINIFYIKIDIFLIQNNTKSG